VNRLIPLDFFLLRTPRFSTTILTDLNKCTSSNELHDILLKYYKNPEIRSALFFASIDVYNQFTEYVKTGNIKKKERLFLTLYKYLLRMSSRPTPFGQFSGISYGIVNVNTTFLQLASNFNSRIRLDSEFLQKLIEQQTIPSSTKDNVTFFSNTSIYIQGNYISYVEFNDNKDGRSFQWRRLKNNPLLSLVLKSSKAGLKYGEIIETLRTLGVAENKSRAFIDELISIKFLISECEPCVTCGVSSTCSNSVVPKNLLGVIQSDFNSLDLAKIDEVYNNIKEHSQRAYKHIFQIDSQRDTVGNTINKNIINQITREIEELSILSNKDMLVDLQIFKDKFNLKYGDQEIPLLGVFDPENGIGYGNTNNFLDDTLSLLGDIKKNNPKDSLEEVNSLLFSILDEKLQAKSNRLHSVELTESDLDRFKNREKIGDLPIGIYLMGNLLWEEEKNGIKSDFKFNLLSAGGVSSLPLMTRFSHLDDQLNKKLHEIAGVEEQLANSVILAEIVFSPNRRAGNILNRPSLYKHEIPIIGQSSVDHEHAILLDDLFISVREGRVILRSKRLNKEILPRLSSAHNFHYGMVIYRFLCDLQQQDNCFNIHWNWGSLSSKPFLPRVTYKHLILSRACWIIRKRNLETTDPQKLKGHINLLKSNYILPDRVLLVDGDNELLIDLNNPLGSEILLKELSKKDIILYEYIYDNYVSAVVDERGEPFNNEIILPFKGSPIKKKVFKHISCCTSVKKQFTLGSEWLYFKVYCSERNWDSILTGPIQLLISKLSKDQQISKWFFIRYYDPEPHLRVRLLLTEEALESFLQIIQLINHYFDPFFNKQVNKITYNAYNRELERYGASNIENCETLFFIESNFVLSVLPIIRQIKDNNLRWLIAMKAINILMDTFLLNLQDKFALAESIKEKFMLEFNHFNNLKVSLDMSYREKGKIIQGFFDDPTYPMVNTLLQQYQVEIKDIIAKCQLNSDFNDRPTEILASLIHMFLNRVFPQKQREQEMVIYHFLSKYLLTEIKKFSNKV